MERVILTLNAGSSSIKLGLFEIGSEGPVRLAGGVIDLHQTPARMTLTVVGQERREMQLETSEDVEAVLGQAIAAVERQVGADRLRAVAHRVVHGGDRFTGPVVIDDRVLTEMEALAVLAPLHQPQALHLVRTIRRLRPDLLQTASFDTAFHRTMPERVRRFALPRALHDEGIRRYGFHGISYSSIAATLAREHPELAQGRVIAAHLGSGASLCAMRDGISQDTSMGFSTLEGVPMATRCGRLDPGVILHLLGPGGRSLAEVEDLLYHRSGLLGVSGVSADSRVLLASAEPEAAEALDLFAFRVAGEVARLTVALGGIDALVFSAGIGENQPAVRSRIADYLAWLGITLDPAANAANARKISIPGARVACLVIPTDEELTLAEEAASHFHV